MVTPSSHRTQKSTGRSSSFGSPTNNGPTHSSSYSNNNSFVVANGGSGIKRTSGQNVNSASSGQPRQSWHSVPNEPAVGPQFSPNFESQGFFPASSSTGSTRGSGKTSPGRYSGSSSKGRPRGKLVPSSGSNGSHNNVDQLAHIKDNWNVQRDIPSGVVKNNPFLPQPKPAAPQPVQLMHQKKQWDTSDIPRGAVAARAMSMESDGGDSSGGGAISGNGGPGGGFRRNSNTGPSTPGSISRSPQGARTVVNNQGWQPQPIPMNMDHPLQQSTGSKGKGERRSFSPTRTRPQQERPSSSSFNNYTPNDPSPTPIVNPRWEPSREIPKGTVKGRASNFLGAVGSGGPESLPVHEASTTRAGYIKSNTPSIYNPSANKTQVKRMTNPPHSDMNRNDKGGDANDDEDDEDPWIITDRTTGKAKLFPGDWGEAVVSAKSSESEDWDTPAKDWFGSNESQTTTSNNDLRNQISKSAMATNPIARIRPQTSYAGPPHEVEGQDPQKQQQLHQVNSRTLDDAVRKPSTLARYSEEMYSTGEKEVQQRERQPILKQDFAPVAPLAVDDNDQRDAEVLQMAKKKKKQLQEQQQEMLLQRPKSNQGSRGSFDRRDGDIDILQAAKEKAVSAGQGKLQIPGAASANPPALAPPNRDASAYHEQPVASAIRTGQHPGARSRAITSSVSTSTMVSSFRAFDDSFDQFASGSPLPETGGFTSAFIGTGDDGFGNFNVNKAFPADRTSSTPAAARKTKETAKREKTGQVIGSSDSFGFPLAAGKNVVQNEDQEEFFDAVSSNKHDGQREQTTENPRPLTSANGSTKRSIIPSSPSPAPRILPVAPISRSSSSSHRNLSDDSANDDDSSNGDEPKQKKKGFFKGLFGRKKKEKDPKSKESKGKKDKVGKKERVLGRKNGDSSSKRSIAEEPALKQESPIGQNSSGVGLEQQSTRGGPLIVNTMVEHSSTENQPEGQNGRGQENPLRKPMSEDETTVSEMTVPSVFRDISNPLVSTLKERMSPALSTIASKEGITPSEFGDEADTPKATSPTKSSTKALSPTKSIKLASPTKSRSNERESIVKNHEFDNPAASTEEANDPEIDHLERDGDRESDEEEISDIGNDRAGKAADGARGNAIAPPPPSPPPPPPMKTRNQTLEPVTLNRGAASRFNQRLREKSPIRGLSEEKKEDDPSARKFSTTQGDREKTGDSVRTTRRLSERSPGRKTLRENSPALTGSPAGNKADVNLPRKRLEGQSIARNPGRNSFERTPTDTMPPQVEKVSDLVRMEERMARVSSSPAVVMRQAVSRVSSQHPAEERVVHASRFAKKPFLQNREKHVAPAPQQQESSNDEGNVQSRFPKRHFVPEKQTVTKRSLEGIKDSSIPKKPMAVAPKEGVISSATTHSAFSRSIVARKNRRPEVSPQEAKATKHNMKHTSQIAITPPETDVQSNTKLPRATKAYRSNIIRKSSSEDNSDDQNKYGKAIPHAETRASSQDPKAIKYSAKQLMPNEFPPQRNGLQASSSKLSRATQAYRSNVVRKSASEESSDDRKKYGTAILATATSASEGSNMSSSSLTPYQKKLADSLKKSKLAAYPDASIRLQRSADFSIRSQLSTDSSIESDVRVLRMILRRPRLGLDDTKFAKLTKSQEQFPTYDEDSVTDPMQRAGLRLLSAAIIPIQTEVRKFLATRRALTRMWALIVIQTYTRRWQAQCGYRKVMKSIISIQSFYRGHDARDKIINQQVCAIEIQRFVRGYLATLRVYEEIYKVTLVQSWVRMRIAMDDAAYRMALVIQLQAVARGFLARRHLQMLDVSATTIQSSWRCFYSRLTYQFDLLDIIIVQSLWRKKKGIQVASDKLNERRTRAATVIQAEWRAFDCRMDYICYIAARVIQTKVRASICAKNYKQYKAARLIQAEWRAYDCRMDYICYLAARMVQTRWRTHVCRRDFLAYLAARTIQTRWRMYVCRREFLAHLAARRIQTNWRRFKCRKEYIEYYAATMIQANWRSYTCRKAYIEYYAATMLQAKWRSYLHRKEFVDFLAARMIQTKWRASVCRRDYVEYLAARMIQSNWRSSVCRKDYTAYIAARTIQTNYRGSVCRRDYLDYLAARMIQTHWRASTCRMQYRRIQAATLIQATWRSYDCSTMYRRYCAARTIQKTWRSFDCKMNYLHFLADILIVQSTFRRYLVQKAVAKQKFQAARLIQSVWRGFVCVADYHEYKVARKIQAAWRGYRDFSEYKRYKAASVIQSKRYKSATMIQSQWRRFVHFADYQEYLTVRKIQTVARRYIHLTAYRRYIAARNIQAAWRGHLNYAEFKRYRAAVTIQSLWRGFVHYADYQEYLTIRRIQAAWRGHVQYAAYRRVVAAKKIQTAWRGYTCCMDYKRWKSAIIIQNAWRGFVCYADYMFSIADILVVQKAARGWLARRVASQRRVFVRENAALKIQKNWRRFVDETEYVVMKYEYYAARTIQTVWRRFWCFSNFIIALDCSIQIQAQVRGYLQQKVYATKRAAAVVIQSQCRRVQAGQLVGRLTTIDVLAKASVDIYCHQDKASTDIQRVFRGGLARMAIKIYLAAVKIQSIIRGTQARVAVRIYVMARRIQCIWRRYTPRNAYITYTAARRIQSKWRFVKANRIFVVLRGEHLAAVLIQSAWRGFICYTDYVFKISDVVAAQKFARGYLARNKYGNIIRANLGRKEVELTAAVVIQQTYRGYQARQKYWYTLGCTMQIQSWWRGRRVMLAVQKHAKALSILQCFARRMLARQQYLQRKFIFLLIQTAEAERSKKLATIRIQEQMREYMDQRERDAAARTIQRFFLRVKYEVDQLVLATKCRKKWRKKMKTTKKRNNVVEEALLEDAWVNAVSQTSFEEEPFVRQYTNLSPGSVRGDSTIKNVESAAATQSIKLNTGDRTKQHPRYRLPPTVPSERPSTVVRLHHNEDDGSDEFSQLTGSTMTYNRPSHMPRIRKGGAIDIDDEFQLEEAFIDAEIHHAKERRQLAGSGRSRDARHHSSSGAPSSSRAPTTSSRRSTGGASASSRSSSNRRQSHDGIGKSSDSQGRRGEVATIQRTWSKGSRDPEGSRVDAPRSSTRVKILTTSNNY